MRKLLLQIVVLSPVILTFCWMNPKSAIALEVDRQTNAPTPTNVSQSADIAPSSWAFQALLSLAKRYSCPIVAPVGTTLGDRPLKRSEFAVSLNSCLVNVDRAIAAGTPKVGPEDLAIVQRLQTEFAPELATLRGRVDALEARSGELEQNRNPPLSEPNSVPLPAPSPQTAPQRVRLNLDSRTSGNLIGQDTLRTRNFGGINQPVTPLPSPTTTALPAQTQQFDREGYNRIYDNSYQRASNNPLSTFGIDVDTASYSNVRRFINSGVMPPKDAVRLEELINYFTYDYPQPKGDQPFSINTEVANAPWNPQHKLVHIGLQGKSISTKNLPPNNLVFLIDVSGSMNSPDKLPLVKASLKYLVSELRAKDSVTIVVYAGAAGLVLPPTPGNQKEKILDSIDKLEAGGSTAGGAGIQLAYKVAKDNFIKQGNNRVILATDGDFNVGVSSDGELVRMIEEKREQGVFLSVLGFGTGNLQDAKMEQLADKGNGNYAYIDSLLEAKKVLVTQMGGTLFTIAKDVKIQVEFNPAKVQAYRLVGYENRVLQNQDFNDDKKDAGELGAGHSVTAIYEIIPVGVASDVKLPEVDPLKYQPNPATASTSQTDELMQVKLRYKNPNETVSQLITQSVIDKPVKLENASANFRFAAAVAAFGMVLRDSEYKGAANFDQVLRLASQAKGEDKEGYRAEFIRLVENCKTLVAKIGVK
ncbi:MULTISPECIES: VWA domain-containing protein [unclassified Microcoleus]|uniref:VWA domain-containing protein n=1 Tax=unclassified Microcoleus TaxID=2642155 RepID=UPI001DF5E81A|nr:MULTISPECIES: VWA domain-containing protein [unclassified Microcoleus]MCC3431369.1 VWA domain-containing protein [Microcoleus sp. PH2017_04_SCI_O_A]MCC3465354.1 VWA domain-containing protein [Microcoleus sp. PH2017_06_SFM_O_A]MCC3414939.1 VWA domain-containing protein [Microcoleus sp. PH2017_02_FOX_O_A]MCC3450353.1 VWA domain-containing protein [Microcoleus sp. PH2017_09_SFU_O_A]MCC3493229.1 VWA domain-containing protein [Microcoleus sp. PH2017_16_JOR_D_A]